MCDLASYQASHYRGRPSRSNGRTIGEDNAHQRVAIAFLTPDISDKGKLLEQSHSLRTRAPGSCLSVDSYVPRDTQHPHRRHTRDRR
jgi:hypothetical protein